MSSRTVAIRELGHSHFDAMLTASSGQELQVLTVVAHMGTATVRDIRSALEKYLRGRVKNMGIEQVVTAPRSSWQDPYVERLIGSIRRDCLDHMIVLNEKHLRRILISYFSYYHHWRIQRWPLFS